MRRLNGPRLPLLVCRLGRPATGSGARRARRCSTRATGQRPVVTEELVERVLATGALVREVDVTLRHLLAAGVVGDVREQEERARLALLLVGDLLEVAD